MSFARENRADILWSIPDSAFLLRLTLEVASRLRLPLLTMVWDPPSFFAENIFGDPWTVSHMEGWFREILRRSTRIAAVSESMQAEFRHATKADCVVIRHGFPECQWRAPKVTWCSTAELRIGFAGGLYAKAEWRSFLRAIELGHGEVGGRRVRIVFVGRRPRTGVPTAPFVEYVGSRTPEEAIEAMSRVDLCYVPYWFSEARAQAATLCFPSKISAYAAAGTPILFHGPEYGSPAKFLRRYPMGLCCHSLKESAILDTLRAFVNDEQIRQRAAEAIPLALEEQLGRAAMLRGFARLIGISPTTLAVN